MYDFLQTNMTNIDPLLPAPSSKKTNFKNSKMRNLESPVLNKTCTNIVSTIKLGFVGNFPLHPPKRIFINKL